MKQTSRTQKNHKTAIIIVAAAILAVAAILALLLIATNGQEPTPPATSQPRIMTLSSQADLLYNPANPSAVAALSSNIAIAYIDSVDGADNYGYAVERYVAPYSYGRMTILRNLVGTLPEGTPLRFYRLGGTITIEQYLAGLSAAEQKNASALKDRYDMVTYRFDNDDLEVEAGKTYLVYLVKETVYTDADDAYEIVGHKGGLREIQTTADFDANTDLANIKVRNNYSGKWDKLSDIPMQE